MDMWTSYSDMPSDEKVYMTTEERDKYTKFPIPSNSVIIGGSGGGDKNDTDIKFNEYITQGMSMDKRNSMFNNEYNRDNDLAKKENLISKELDRIKNVTSKVDNVVKILKRDCKEIANLPDMIKSYYKYTRSWYSKDDDDDNLNFIEDTEMIHPIHKTFYMYDMLKNTKTNDDDNEDYKNLMWSGLSHIFTQKLDKSVSPVSWMKIAIMDYCATHIRDPQLNPKELMETFVDISNSIQPFINTVSPIIKKYIIYTLLFSKKWIPTVKLEQSQDVTFLNQHGVLLYDIAELKDFCIIYNKSKDVYIYIHNKNIEEIVELPKGLNISSTIDYLLYDEKRMNYISQKWYNNLTRRRRLVIQSVNSKELKERIELYKTCDPNMYNYYLGDYEQNREQRLNESIVTSDISWAKDTEYQREKLEQDKKKTNEKLKEMLSLEDEKIIKSHKQALKKEKISYDEQLERYKMAKSIKDQMEDLKQRVRVKESSEANRIELIKLKNQSLQYKMEYAKELHELRTQYQDITNTERNTALLKKKQSEIDLEIGKLSHKFSEDEAMIRCREIALDQRKNEILNNLVNTTFDDVKKYNDVTGNVVDQAMDRYNTRALKYALENTKKKLKLVNLDLPSTSTQKEKEEEEEEGGGSSSRIDNELSAIEIANQLKDLKVIAKAKTNKDYEKITMKESESNAAYYKQLAKLADQLRLSKEENSKLHQNKKLEDHDRKTKLANEFMQTKALEDANQLITNERSVTSKLLTDLYNRENELLKLQLKFMTQGMSEKMKISLDKEYNTDMDKILNRSDKIQKARDRMELVAMKCDNIDKLENYNVNTIPPKEAMFYKHKLNNLAVDRQVMTEDRRYVKEQQKNYDSLLTEQTKQSERQLNQTLRELCKISKDEDDATKKLRNKTKDNMKEIANFQKKSKEILGNMENLEDLFSKDYNEEDEENILDRTTFLSEDLMTKLYEKIDNATNLISDLPDMYTEYATTIKNTGIDLSTTNPYHAIDKRVGELFDASQSKYIRMVTDMYEHVQKIYESISGRMSKLHKTMEYKLGVDDQDEDVKDQDDDDDDCPFRINHSLADQTTQEQRVFAILDQANTICDRLTTECTSVHKDNEKLLIDLHKLQNKFNISETKNNTTARTMKMQHVLIENKHKEIGKAIQQFQTFFKSNMQQLMKLTEKAVRENQKKVDQLKKGMKKIHDKNHELKNLAEYTKEYEEFTQNQETTIKELVNRREEAVKSAKRSYENAFEQEKSHRTRRLSESKLDCDEAKRKFQTNRDDYVKHNEEFINNLVQDIDNDLTKSVLLREFNQKVHTHRANQIKDQYNKSAEDLQKFTDMEKERWEQAQNDMKNRQLDRETLLNEFNTKLDEAATKILYINSLITDAQKVALTNELDMRDLAEQEPPMVQTMDMGINTEDMDQSPPLPPSGTTTTTTTTTTLKYLGNNDDDNTGGGEGMDIDGGDVNILNVPTGRYKKKGGKLLVINDPDNATLIREGNDRIENAEKNIKSREKELDAREKNLSIREKQVAELRETGGEPPIAPALNEDVLRDNLTAHQRKLFNNTKLDLIRKLDADSNLIGTDKSTIRKDFIEQQKRLLEDQKKMIDGLIDEQRNPEGSSNLENPHRNIIINKEGLARPTDKLIFNRCNLGNLEVPVTTKALVDLSDVNNLSEDIRKYMEPPPPPPLPEDTTSFLSSIAELRAKNFDKIIDNVREEDMKNVEKHYNDRIKKYIENAKRKNRFEALCNIDSNNKESINSSRGVGISHIPFLDEDIIFLERSTLAHDDTVPQLNHDNIDIIYKQLRRKWELLTADLFKSIVNVNINGVKTGESVDIIYILEHLIKNCMKLLTNNRIDFKVIISSSDIALNEYELFYELQSKKCKAYYINYHDITNRSREEQLDYNLDKELRKVTTHHKQSNKNE